MNKIIEYDLINSDSDIYIQTHSTSPLLTIKTLDSAIKKMIKKSTNFDSIFSVTKIQTRFYHKNGNPFNHDPKNFLEPRIWNLCSRRILVFIFLQKNLLKILIIKGLD